MLVLNFHMNNDHVEKPTLIVTENRKLSGDLAVWFFILAEVTVFAIFFFAYCSMYYLKTDMFVTSQLTLHPIAGLINTLALISSSFLVAAAVIFAKEQQNSRARKALFIALLLSMIYVVTKLWEYSVLIEAGYSLSTNTFFMFYFFITGFIALLLGALLGPFQAFNYAGIDLYPFLKPLIKSYYQGLTIHGVRSNRQFH